MREPKYRGKVRKTDEIASRSFFYSYNVFT